jgi:dTDP-4-dehydrorhamnose reductase
VATRTNGRPPRPRWLITGGSGLLGSNLAMMASSRAAVWTTYCEHPLPIAGCDSIALDLRDPAQVAAAVRRVGPQLIIHTAALTDVDYCQQHLEEAWAINAEGAAAVAAAAGEVGARLVYISTDAVFKGDRGGYREQDTAHPVNHYAASKLAGEVRVRSQLPGALVVRTTIYGWNARDKHSLAEWIRDGLMRGQALPLFSDVFFTPILVNDLADALFDLIELRATGVYHVAGSQRCSKHAFGLALAEVFGCNPSPIRAASIAESELGAPRPRDPSLCVDKAQAALGRPLPDVRQGLARFKALWDSGYVAALKAADRALVTAA